MINAINQLALNRLNGSTALAGIVNPPSEETTYGAPDPFTFYGPLGGEATYTTPRGVDIAPSGSGRWLYVDLNVSSSGDGLSAANAFKTITEGIAARQAGDTILVNPGVYNETLLPDPFGSEVATLANPISIAKRGIGRVLVSGADALTGWTQCTSSAQVDGNANYAAIWFIDVTPSAACPLNYCILKEDGVIGSVVMDGENMSTADDMMIPQHKALWYNGDAGGSTISDLTKSAQSGSITINSSHFQTFSAGQLDDTYIWVNAAANTSVEAAITSYNVVTGDLTFTNSSGQNWEGKELALRNIPALISAEGQWAFKDNGDSTWRIFYYPRNSATIDTTMMLSQRDEIMDLDNSSHWRFYGIDFGGAGGEPPSDARGGAVFSKQQNTGRRSNIVFERCTVEDCTSGGLQLIQFDDLQVYDCTVQRMIFTRGGVFNDAHDSVYYGNYFNLTASTAVSMYSQWQTCFAHNSIGEVRSVHGNGCSLYISAGRCVMHANIYNTKYAIAQTLQDSGDLYFTSNVIFLGSTGGAIRGLEDNGNRPAGYEPGGDLYDNVAVVFPSGSKITMACNTVLPYVGYTDADNTVAFQTQNTTNADHNFFGNIGFGKTIFKAGTNTDPGPPVVNYTATLTNTPSYNAIVGSIDASNSIIGSNGNINVTDADAVWTDPTSGPGIIENSAVDVTCGDITAHLPHSESWFTALPGAVAAVGTDSQGNTITWTNAPMGAIVGPSVGTTPSAAAQFSASDWSLATGTTNKGLAVTINSLPDANGATITDIQYDVDGNDTWTSLGILSGSVDIEMAAELTSYDIRLRAVNLGGNSTPSASKTASSAAEIANPATIYSDGTELRMWFDPTTGVTHTSNSISAWTDRHGSIVADPPATFSNPTYVDNDSIRFVTTASDGLRIDDDLSGYPNCDIWISFEIDTVKNFILFTRDGNSGPLILIAESGSSGTDPASIAGTVYIDGLDVSDQISTRGEAYTAATASGRHTLFLQNCDMSSLTTLHMLGYISSAWRVDATIKDVVITETTLAGDAAQKRADMMTYMNGLT